MKIEEIFKNCTISIADDNGKMYYFEKPVGFTVELLKVRYGAYPNIVAMVINEYESCIAVCYSTDGYVFDGREGFEKFALVPTTMEKFFKDME